MKLELTRQFEFDSAHFLPSCSGKCGNLHGHRYKLEISFLIKGSKLKNGLDIDLEIAKKIVTEKVVEKLDHCLLNDIIKNPSMENICLWILDQIKKDFDILMAPIAKIRLWETPNNSVTLYSK